MRFLSVLSITFLLVMSTAGSASSGASRMPWHEYSEAEIAKAIEGLRAMDSPELDAARIDALEQRAAEGLLDANDDNLICIGILGGVYAATFGVGLVPNPPWDYLLGQVPAYAANLGLKFCPPVLDAPADLDVYPNIATADGPNCAYTFTQPIVEASRADFMGIPLRILGHWTFNATPISKGFGTPSAFHYNTEVAVRMILPDQAPPDYLLEPPAARYAARLLANGIAGPAVEVFTTVGCLLDGSVTESITGDPCPIDRNRRITLPVGTHTTHWRGETQVGLLDVLPPLYNPGTPPGSKKELAKAILRNAFEALGDAFVGSFNESYQTGVVSLRQQRVRVFDDTVPVISVDPAFQNLRIEAQMPGGQRTIGLRDVLRPGIVASDACNRVPQVSVPIPPFLPLGSHQLTWTASDAGPAPGGGVNSASVVQTIIVEDTAPPEIQAPPPVVVESASAPVAIDIGVPMVFDVVDLEPTVERDGPASFPFGVTVVRWRATDSSGNASHWVDQRVTVKPLGSNSAPVAEDTLASAVSFEEATVTLSAADADGDHLFFYIDRQPDEGFFVAPLLPVFVEDLRVERQVTIVDLQHHCATVNAPLPPQSFIYKPQYVTVDDDGTSFVIDRELYCFGSSLPRSLFDRARIARIGADGELLGQHLFSGMTTITKLSFHPGGLPGYEQPFVYWVDRGTQRLLVLEQTLSGAAEVIRANVLPPGTIPLGDYVDAAIDRQGIAYVASTHRVYAYDFLTRDAGGNNAMLFLGRLGAPASQSQGDFGQAWDMDIDSHDNVYVGDWERSRIYKFGASTLTRIDGGPDLFTSGETIGWLGRCDSDLAPGDAAVCNVALGRSFGYSCTDTTCGTVQTAGSLPGQFNRPQGFAIDPNDILYIADRQNNRIQRFTPEGLVAGLAQSDCSGINCFVIGQFGTAMDVSVNSTSFFVLDEDTDILHIFSSNPVTMTGPTTAEVTYRSFNNFIGVDTFDFFASDGLRVDGELVRSNVATASIAVERNFRPPFATPGISAIGDEDTAIPIVLDGSDPDIGDSYPWEPLETLGFAISTPPGNGSISIDGNVATYMPDPDWNGFDGFAFTVSDGTFTSAPEWVEVEVLPVNDPPQLTAPTAPRALIAGVGFQYELSVAVRDPDEMDEHSVVVDWGDGSVEPGGELLPDGTITGPLIDFNASGDGLITARHTYTSAGPRSIEACATDAEGATGCVEFGIEVLAMTDLALFETGMVREVQAAQPVVYTLGASNLAPEIGSGISATGVTLRIELDPRLMLVGHSGATCNVSGQVLDCTLPNLAPIARGDVDGIPPIDRSITVTTLPSAAIPVGTVLRSEAALAASEPNRSPSSLLAMNRFVVAEADFVVSTSPVDSGNASPGNGVCADAQGRCTLRAAVEEANALGGPRRIALSSASYRIDQGDIAIAGDVEIIGLGVGLSEIISDGPQRVFSVMSGARLHLRGVAVSGTERVHDSGGLLHNLNGTLIVEDAMLQNGQASGGGAIFNSAGATLEMRRVAVVGNHAVGSTIGGAIFNLGSAMLENVLLSGNRAHAGGAIYTLSLGAGRNLTLDHCTVVGNQVSSLGPSLFNGDFTSAPMATISNTILSDNTADQSATECWTRLLSAGGNIIHDDLDLCSFDTQVGDQLGVAPGLEPYIGDGSALPTMQPVAGSPAIGAAVGDCPETDLRGMPHGPGFCDVGAYGRLGDSIFANGFEHSP